MAKAGPLLEPIIPRRRRWSKCQLVDDEQCKWLRWAISDGRRSIHWSVRDENVNYLLVERHPFVFWLPVRMGLYRTVSGGIEACGICHIRRSAINPSMANGTHPPVATNNNIFFIDLPLRFQSRPHRFVPKHPFNSIQICMCHESTWTCYATAKWMKNDFVFLSLRTLWLASSSSHVDGDQLFSGQLVDIGFAAGRAQLRFQLRLHVEQRLA